MIGARLRSTFRRARKQERQLKKALSVVKDHADEIHTKLAAWSFQERYQQPSN